MIKHYFITLKTLYYFCALFLLTTFSHAQTITTFDRVGSSSTKSVVLAWNFEGTLLNPLVSEFTVKEGSNDITSTSDISIVENVAGSDYTIYVNLGDNYEDTDVFSLSYSTLNPLPADTTAVETYTIDTSASLESNVTTFSLNSISDLGESNSDGITSMSNLLFSVTSTATNIVYLKTGHTTLASTIATGSANLVVTSSLADGNYQIYAYGEDTNGNITFTSEPIEVTIDTSAPNATGALSLNSSSDTGASNSDGVTSDTEPMIDIPLLPLEVGNEVVIESSIDGEVARSNYALASSSFTLATLSEGVHTLTYVIEDSAGNESSTSAGITVTVDTTDPIVPVLSLTSSSDSGRDDSDGKTTDTTPTLNVKSETGTSIELFIGMTSKSSSITSTGDDDITSSSVSPGAIYTYICESEDLAGNVSTSNNKLVDVKVNSIGALTAPTLNSDSGDTGDNKTNIQTPIYAFTGLNTADDKELIIESDIDGEVARISITNTSHNVTLNTLSEGNHTLTYYAEDVYGTTGSTSTTPLEIDITPPSLSSVTITSNNSSNSSMVESGDQSTVTFVSSEDLKSSFNVTINGNSVVPSKSSLTYTASRTFSSAGSYSLITFSIPVEDEAGNSITSVTSTTDGSTNRLFPSLSNSITAPGTTDYCGSSTYNFTVNGSTATGGSGTYTYSWQRQFNSDPYTTINSFGEDYTESSGLANGTYKYRRVATSEGISINSNEVTVYVRSDISNNTISSSSTATYCNTIPANTLTFTATTPTGGNGSYNYRWQMSTDGGLNWSNTSGTSATYTHTSTISSAGTYMFRRRVKSGGCTDFSNTETFTLTSSISNNTVSNNSGSLVCLNGSIILTGSTPTGGNSGYSYQWQQSFNGGSYTNISGATSQSYFISSISTSGTYLFRRIVTSGPCFSTSSASSTITVPAQASGYTLSPSTTNYSDQQTTGVALDVGSLGGGEDFYCSGTGVVSTATGSGNNTFYPNLAGQGSHTINYHITKGGCEKVETVTFTVYDGSSVINLSPLYCEDDGAVALSIPGGTPAFVGGTPPYTLVRFEGTGTSGAGVPSGATFTPATVVAATADGQDETVTITAVYEDAAPTPVEFSVSQAVTVTKNHVASINLTQLNYCIDASDFSVTANLNGSLTTDGSFQLDSNPPTSNPITISPSSLSTGNHTLTYNYTDGNGCAASDMVTIAINPLPTVSFDYALVTDDGDFCFDADTVFLQGMSGGSNVSSGTFSSSDALAGAIVSYGDGTGAFIPSLANTDEFDLNQDFTITFTYTDGNSCINSVDSVVTVYGYDEVTLARSSSSDSVCYSDGDVTLTPMEGGAAYSGSGVTWSINTGSSGITTQMDGTVLFHPSVAAVNAGETSTSDYSEHVITYSYENVEGCTREVKDTIYVKPLPVAPTLVSTVPSYCSQDTGLQDLEVSGVTGAQFAWSSDASFTTILSTTNTLTPADAPTVSTTTIVSYWVRQTNTESCTSAPLQVDITIYPKATPPTLSLSNQTTYCSGEVISALSVAMPGNSIKWYSDAGLTTQVGFGDNYTPAVNTNVTADSTVTFYVTETTNSCEGLATSITLTIYKTPNPPTFNPVALLCSGDALTSLSIASGSNVKWYSDAAATTQLGTGNNYLPSFGTDVLNDSTVTIYATSTLNGCESATASVDININALPVSPTVNTISPYCEGDPIQSITASGEAGASFEWYSDNTLTTLEATTATFNPSINAPSYPTLDTLNYWVIQIATDGCKSPAFEVDIPVYPRPLAPTLDASNQLVYCSGETVNMLSVGTPGNSIKWYSDAGLTTQVGFGDTFTPAINTNVSADSTVTYYVTETTNGCEGSATSTTITIYKTPDAPTFNPVALLCSGDPLASISVATGVNVIWYSDAGATTQLGTGNNYLPSFGTNVVNDSTVTLYATSTLNGCESTTASVDININALPALPTVPVISPYCEGDPIQAITASGEGTASFEWYSDEILATRVATTATFNPSVNAPSYPTLDTLNYWVLQIASDGCVGPALKVDIPVHPRPSAPAMHSNNQLIYCSGDAITSLSVATAGNSIKWYSDAGLTTQVGFGDTFTPAINTNVSADSTVTYYATETTNGCEGSATSTTITIYKTPDSPTFNPVALLCSGDVLASISVSTGINVKWYSDAAGTNLLGTGNNYLPTFSSTVVNDSTVTLYATSTLNGCESPTAGVDIVINALPALPTVPTISPYCEGDPIQSMTASGESGASFEWYSDHILATRVATTATFDPSINAPSFSTLDTVNYWVLQIASDGCVGPALKVNIPVYPRPAAPALDTQNKVVYCSGEAITALSVQNPGNNIKWYSDAALTNQIGLGDSFTPSLSTNVSADSTATYYVTETTNGCEGSATTATITIYKTPDAPTFNPVGLVCSGEALSSISIASGTGVKWYSDASKTTLLGLGNNYLPTFSSVVAEDSIASLYATSTLNGCESAVGKVDIYINALPESPVVNEIQPYCEAEVIQPISATGEASASFEWYTDEGLTLRASTNQVFNPGIVAPSFSSLDTVNYWVVQITPDGCVSLPTKVNIPVYPTPSKPLVDNRNPVYCSGDEIQPITVTSGSNIRWYDDDQLSSIVSTNTSFTPPDPNSLQDYTKSYYITQTVNGCESDTTEITMTINRRPEIPSVAATLSYCSGDILQPMIVSSIAEDVTWYSDASLTQIVGNSNSFTPSDETSVTEETTYTYYVTDSHLGCEGQSLRLDIVIHPLPLFDLFGIQEGDIFCASDNNPNIITTVSGGVLTSSTGALIRANSEVVLENSPLGNHTIRYTYTNENSCVNYVERNFTIVDVPEVDFDFNVFCDTRIVEFRDQTTLNDSTEIISWFYDFGVGEGSKYITDADSAASYEHTFSSSGFKTVKLTVQTNEGCTNISTSKSIFIGTPPNINFDWKISEFGSNMEFKEVSSAIELDTLLSWEWDFGDGTTQFVSAESNDNGAVNHMYQSTGNFDVTLTVTTKRGCSRRLVKSVYVIPRVFLTNEDDIYFEDFNTTDGGWIHRGISSSWEHGVAQGENIISDTKVWVTNLTTDYNVSEDSYLNTPSFDISGLSRPMIIFDMQLDAEAHIDGVTLQYSLDSGQTWNVLGNVNDPLNWFNSPDILADPGHQINGTTINDAQGWTGNTPETGGIFREFKSIRHNLDQFIGEENLRLRFAFKSNSDLEDEGVAIDNVFIGNRKKLVLVETMTNAGQQEDSRDLPDLDSVLQIISEDVLAINYHIKVDGKSDSLNIDNPEPASGRQFYYGISSAPSSIVDGNSFKGHTEDFIDNYQNNIATRALLDPKFDIDIKLPASNESDEIEVTIKSNAEFDAASSEIVVHIVTVETEIFGVEVSEGVFTHHDVMKSMSPSPGSEGTSFFGRSWSTGSSETFKVKWDNPQVYDTDKARVIAFVQDNRTREVFQAIQKDVSHLVSTDPPITSIENNEIFAWNIYPNPTADKLHIQASSLLLNCQWTLSSIDGKGVMQGSFSGDKYSINLEGLPIGVYYLRHFGDDGDIGKAQKVVVIK